jgi:hypothetical protein
VHLEQRLTNRHVMAAQSRSSTDAPHMRYVLECGRRMLWIRLLRFDSVDT